MLALSNDRLTQKRALLQASTVFNTGCCPDGNAGSPKVHPFGQALKLLSQRLRWQVGCGEAHLLAAPLEASGHIAVQPQGRPGKIIPFWDLRRHAATLGPVHPSVLPLKLCRVVLRILKPLQQSASPSFACHPPQRPPAAHPAVACLTTVMQPTGPAAGQEAAYATAAAPGAGICCLLCLRWDSKHSFCTMLSSTSRVQSTVLPVLAERQQGTLQATLRPAAGMCSQVG